MVTAEDKPKITTELKLSTAIIQKNICNAFISG